MAELRTNTSTKKRAIGLILARGGSKGIKLKNIKLLAGRPLLYWTFHALRDSGIVDDIWVSTDHDEIDRVAREAGALIHRRGAEVSKDSSTSVQAILEFLEIQKPNCDIIVHSQITCPCIKPTHFQEIMKMYESGNYDSIFSVVRLRLFRWQEDTAAGGTVLPLNVDPYNRPQRKRWNGELYENGAVYVTRKDLLENHGILQGGKVGCYEMEPHLFVDIDVPDDWPIAEDRVRKYGYNPKTADQKIVIKLLVSDADGTLTNGQAYVSSNGRESRSYSSVDLTAVRKIKQLGVEVRIVTTSKAGAHVHWAKQADCPIATGTIDKLAKVDEWRKEMSLEWSQVAYIGDDFFDLECIKKAGVSGAPANASREIQQHADYITSSTGGNGAVRDFCKYLMETCCSQQSQ
ncbi:N-acylneuraminate cytidylyltransferase-like [Corticium candelabrum]|uniref:N-acylneuraminate cytidylyltransferase-like n=1 Tax=Corticium candelabrum TaxID=121492 RepID=UPI002E26A8CE|nr:N-acylneuraminate cytidylyltransferase-like [Corticium candelabrum]